MVLLLADFATPWQRLLPLTFTRPIAGLRLGIVTIAEKWAWYSSQTPGYLTLNYLADLYRHNLNGLTDALIVSGHILPDNQLWQALIALPQNSKLVYNDQLIGLRINLSEDKAQDWQQYLDAVAGQLEPVAYPHSINQLSNPTDLFALNGQQIRQDFEWLTKGRTSAPILDPHTIVYGAQNIFIEEGVTIKASIINAEEGPVYLGKNVQVQEGVMIKGPLAVCEGGVLNMGAKLRGDNTVGPFSKVGGEVSNSILMYCSNKGHDGFLGNSVLGAWCNLGADTNNSNLKNNYRNVTLFDYHTGNQQDTGKLFCGLIMGDHSKAGINTMFNTGTVVGVGCNVYGGGFPEKHIPSFSWGGPQEGYATYKLSKLVETERTVMARRKIDLTPAYEAMLENLFNSLKDRNTGKLNYWDLA